MSQREPPVLSEGRGRILIVLAVPLFMILLDVTIVVIAMPRISQEFNVGISSIEWVLNVYTLVFAVLLITLGRLGDNFGRKYLFLAGLIVFTAGSAMCAASPNFGFLLFSRGIQAAGAAAMLPATLSILNVTFARRGRGLALGVWGGIAGAANALGPVLGGVLVNAYSWRSIFLVNVPVGILAIAAALVIIKNSTDPSAVRRLDLPGIITVSASLFALTYALVQGQSYGWSSAIIIGLLAAAAILFLTFLAIESRTSAPLIPLSLFRNRNFAAGNGVALLSIFGLIGALFLLTIFLQVILGFSALRAGVTLLPLPLAIVVTAPVAGRLTDRIGGRWLLFSGMLLAAIGVFLLSFLSLSTTQQGLVLPLIITGLGIGMVMAPTTTVVMASTPVEKSGAGAGVLSTTRQVGTALGIAVLGAVLLNRLVADISNALSQIAMLPPTLRQEIIDSLNSGSLFSLAGGVIGIPPALMAQVISAVGQQFANALNFTMRVSVVFLAIGAVIALFVSKPGTVTGKEGGGRRNNSR